MSLKRTNDWMGRTAAALLVSLMVLTAGTAVADEAGDSEPDAEMSAEKLAERIQHFYAQTEDFQASFTQKYTDVAAGQTTRSRGRVFFKKPGMMRWDYYHADRDERDRMLVSDGDHFWVYEYEYQQVFQQCLEESQLPTALRFLMGEGELLEDFEVSLTDESTPERPVMELVPEEPTADYRKLEFAIDPESFEVDQSTLYDPYGNTNTIEFHDARVNQNLAAEGFDFEVPEGARMLNPEQECD